MVNRLQDFLPSSVVLADALKIYRAICVVASLTPLYGPFVLGFLVASSPYLRAILEDGTQDVNVRTIIKSWVLSLVFLVFLVGFCLVFVSLVVFVFVLFGPLADMYRSISLLWLSVSRRPCMIRAVVHLSNVLNDLTKAMKASDGKKAIDTISKRSLGFYTLLSTVEILSA